MVFRKVLLMEDNDQNIHLKNLSTHQANNEEDALNLLFLGDTNRMIAEVWRTHHFCSILSFSILVQHNTIVLPYPVDWLHCIAEWMKSVIYVFVNHKEALKPITESSVCLETPMNQASTRSHCIFTIHITSRESGSATIRRSKLHLVDLAG